MDSRLTPYEEKMQKSYENLVEEYATIRAGRANPHILDRITVDYYEHRPRYSRLQISMFRSQE